jgi:hypothetical protein
MMVTTIITTRNGRYTKTHETTEYAWKYIQSFVCVTNDAEWEMVVD